MKKRLLATLLVAVMVAALLPMGAFATEDDFVIDVSGSLTKYNGSGGDVVIPDGVTVIMPNVFYECTGMTSVTMPSSVTAIGSGAFAGCTALTSVTIPSGVFQVGGSAFANCSNLTDVTIPDSATDIGGGAFAGTPWLQSLGELAVTDNGILLEYLGPRNVGGVIIPDGVITIAERVFYGCSSLTHVTFPSSVTSIGRETFARTPWLESLGEFAVVNGTLFAYQGLGGDVTIPDSVTRICWPFFDLNDWTGERTPTSVTIPSSVNRIEFGAFVTGPDITVANDNQHYTSQDGVLFTKDMTRLIQCPTRKTGIYYIPESVTSIGGGAFFRCSKLTNVFFPEGVTNIDADAFYDCTHMTGYGKVGSCAEWYCVENGIPFVAHFGPATTRVGTLERDDGEYVSWDITEAGEVTVDVTTGVMTGDEAILVACYDSGDRFIGVKWITVQEATTQIDPTTPNVKLFWLGAQQNPLSPSVTVWGQ